MKCVISRQCLTSSTPAREQNYVAVYNVYTLKTRIDWLTEWSLMALSAQTGYIVPLKSMLQLKKMKLTRKLAMLQ